MSFMIFTQSVFVSDLSKQRRTFIGVSCNLNLVIANIKDLLATAEANATSSAGINASISTLSLFVCRHSKYASRANCNHLI